MRHEYWPTIVLVMSFCAPTVFPMVATADDANDLEVPCWQPTWIVSFAAPNMDLGDWGQPGKLMINQRYFAYGFFREVGRTEEGLFEYEIKSAVAVTYETCRAPALPCLVQAIRCEIHVPVPNGG